MQRSCTIDNVVHSVASKIAFIEKVFGKCHVSRRADNVAVWCPVCAPRKLDKKKLVIRVEDDINHCWSCGWKARSLLPLIKKYGTREQFNEYVQSYVTDRRKFVEDEPAEHDDTRVSLPRNFQLLAQRNTRSMRYVSDAVRYLQTRGVSESDMWRYRLGVSDDDRWKDRVIMPSYDDDGTVNFFVGRSYARQDRRTKYDNPEFPKKSDVIFNSIDIDWKSRLVICEGMFDLMKCGDNATMLLGSDMSERSALFERVLLNNTPIALALDEDMWNTKTKRLVKLFVSYEIDTVVVDVRGKKDPGSMTKTEFQSLLQSAKCPSWSDMFFEKLDSAASVGLSL